MFNGRKLPQGECRLGVCPSSLQDWQYSLGKSFSHPGLPFSELKLKKIFSNSKIYGVALSPSLAVCCVFFLGYRVLVFKIFSFQFVLIKILFLWGKIKIDISL